MTDKDISIIIPVLNESDFLGENLNQLWEKQSGFVKEILVVDGGSRDDTIQIAVKHGAKVIKAERKGRANQMNIGAKNAQAGVLYFLHADTLPPDGFDQIILNTLKRGFDFGCFRLKFDWEHPLLNLYSFFTRFNSPLFRFGDQSLFVLKESFIDTGGFDENLTVMEDQEIYFRLRKTGRFRVLKHNVITSARKYRTNGVVWLQVIFFAIWLGYYSGVKQDSLVHFYNSQTGRGRFNV
jgi:rSAM/selenodomain-associated transferase 2